MELATPQILDAGAARTRRTAWLLWLCVVPAYALLVARFSNVTDDAYIAFRFARNLAHGHGLTWNPGVDAPVEGFTSPLWVALMTPVEAFGWSTPFASRAISIVCGLVVLRLLASVLLERLRLSTPAALLGLGWTVLMPVFGFWSTGGLETMAFVLLVFACYERLLARERPDVLGASILGVLAFACRFDGLGWIATILATAACFRGAPRSAALRASFAIALGCAALEIARIAYFGDALPNTVYAKMSLGAYQLGRGAYYVARAASVVPSAALIALLALVTLRGRLASPPLAGALALAAATCAYAVLVGGDFMLMFRFLAPAVPFLGVLLAQSYESARHARRGVRVLAQVLAIAALVDALLPSFGVEPGRQLTRRFFASDGERAVHSQAQLFDDGRSVMRDWIALGKALAAHTEPSASVVRGAIGAVGYYSERTVFDTYGLVDRALARMPAEQVPSHARHIGGHDKYGSLSFFEPRRPTYGSSLLVRRAEVERDNPSVVSRMFIAPGDKACMSTYQPVLVPVPEYEDGDWFLALAERAPSPVDLARWSGPLLVPGNLRDAGSVRH